MDAAAPRSRCDFRLTLPRAIWVLTLLGGYPAFHVEPASADDQRATPGQAVPVSAVATVPSDDRDKVRSSSPSVERIVSTVPAVLTILIGGMDSDPTPEQIAGKAPRGSGNSGLYQLRDDLLKAQCGSCEYFNWNGTRAGCISQKEPLPSISAITEFVRSAHRDCPECRLVVVGNSWGGHTAWEVCTQLEQEPAVPVELLVFLDPSSAGRARQSRPARLPENVHCAVNYCTRNLFVWRHWPGEPRLSNVDLGDPDCGFLTPQHPYHSAFDWRAHVLVEWDQRIHDEIRGRIQSVVRPAAN